MPRILKGLRFHGLFLLQKIVHRMLLVLVLVFSKAAIVPHRYASIFEPVIDNFCFFSLLLSRLWWQ